MVDNIINEIDKCLKNNCHIAALTLSLLLPDICGKAMLPYEKSKARYVQWCDKYVIQNYKRKLNIDNAFVLEAESIYELRSALLHEGNPNIKDSIKEMKYFELLSYDINSNTRTITRIDAEIARENGIEVKKNIKYSVDIKFICDLISLAAKDYFDENKEKFNFFNYHIEDVDFETKRMFGIKKK